ncbi:MAG: hypothetical protein PVI86_16095, partial [Phycisphaerae bacterium]
CASPGELTGDNLVNLDDCRVFTGCLTGPGGGLSDGCACTDVDADTDTDLLDAAAFQLAFDGA